MAGAHSGPTGPVSLLFTPTSLKTGDGSRTPDLRGGLRSPRASGSLFGQQASRAPRWDATPAQTRRRSLTPSSSGLARETPPPPPTSSLMDESPGGGEAGTGPAPMDTCSPGRTDADAGALRPAPQPAPYAGCWVTTFGFGPEDLPDVLRELGRCGDLLHWGTYGDGQGVNWLHMKFAVRCWVVDGGIDGNGNGLCVPPLSCIWGHSMSLHPTFPLADAARRTAGPAAGRQPGVVLRHHRGPGRGGQPAGRAG